MAIRLNYNGNKSQEKTGEKNIADDISNHHDDAGPSSAYQECPDDNKPFAGNFWKANKNISSMLVIELQRE